MDDLDQHQRVDVTLDRALAREAEAMHLDLTRILDAAVRKEISDAKAAQWLRDNADAIAANNARLERDGLWSDGLRLF